MCLNFQASNNIINLETQDNDANSYLKCCDTTIDNMSKLTNIIRSLNAQIENNCIVFEANDSNILKYTPPDISKCMYL